MTIQHLSITVQDLNWFGVIFAIAIAPTLIMAILTNFSETARRDRCHRRGEDE